MINILPKVFQNKIDKEFHNNKERTIANRNNISLDNVFDKNKYSFNHIYHITLKDKEIETSIISRDDNNILTIDGEKLAINDIINIYEIKK